MAVRVITPALPVVTLEEAKRHLRVDADETDSNEYIEGLISAAQAWIDGPAGWLGRAIGPQCLELVVDRPTAPIVPLPYGPVLEIVEAWAGEDAVPVEAYVSGAPRFNFGAALNQGQSARVVYWAGYGKRVESPGEGEPEWTPEAPAPVKHAILLLVGQWYHNRASVRAGQTVVEMPFAVEALLSPYRVFR